MNIGKAFDTSVAVHTERRGGATGGRAGRLAAVAGEVAGPGRTVGVVLALHTYGQLGRTDVATKRLIPGTRLTTNTASAIVRARPALPTQAEVSRRTIGVEAALCTRRTERTWEAEWVLWWTPATVAHSSDATTDVDVALTFGTVTVADALHANRWTVRREHRALQKRSPGTCRAAVARITCTEFTRATRRTLASETGLAARAVNILDTFVALIGIWVAGVVTSAIIVFYALDALVLTIIGLVAVRRVAVTWRARGSAEDSAVTGSAEGGLVAVVTRLVTGVGSGLIHKLPITLLAIIDIREGR